MSQTRREGEPIDYVAERIARGLGEVTLRPPAEPAPPAFPDPDPDSPEQKLLGAIFGERGNLETGASVAHPPSMSDREIDAKFEAAEARTDTKFAQLIGRIDATNLKIDHLSDAVSTARSEATSNRNTILGVLVPTLIGGFIAMFFGLFAVLQWSDARMFGAIQFRDGVKPAAISSEPAPVKPAAEPPKPQLDTPTK